MLLLLLLLFVVVVQHEHLGHRDNFGVMLQTSVVVTSSLVLVVVVVANLPLLLLCADDADGDVADDGDPLAAFLSMRKRQQRVRRVTAMMKPLPFLWLTSPLKIFPLK